MSKLYEDNNNQLSNYQTDYSGNSSDTKSFIAGIASAVGAATGLGTLIDNVTGGADHRARKNMRAQAQLNEQAATTNYKRNVEMWNTQNEYDLPVNQMQRYQSASINPNAVISGVTGNSPATMTGADPTYRAPDLNAARAAEYARSQMLMESMQQMANINLTNAQADSVKSDTKNKDIQNKFLPQLLQNQIDVGFGQIKLNESVKNLTDEQINNVYNQSLQIQENMHNIRAQTDLIRENISNINQKTKLDFQQYLFNDQAFAKLLKKYDLDANLTNAQISNVRAATQYLWSQVTGQNLQNSYQRQLNSFGSKIFSDKVSMFRTQRAMLSDQYQLQHINLQSLGKLTPYNNYLNTFNLAASTIRNYMGIAGDFNDLSTKPLKTSTDLIKGLGGNLLQ